TSHIVHRTQREPHTRMSTLNIFNLSSPLPTLDLISFSFLTILPPLTSTLFPYTTLFRSDGFLARVQLPEPARSRSSQRTTWNSRSEEHTSELQSRVDLVCRLLLEKKKNENQTDNVDTNETHTRRTIHTDDTHDKQPVEYA